MLLKTGFSVSLIIPACYHQWCCATRFFYVLSNGNFTQPQDLAATENIILLERLMAIS